MVLCKLQAVSAGLIANAGGIEELLTGQLFSLPEMFFKISTSLRPPSLDLQRKFITRVSG